MVYRETTFLLGGAITIALGIALAAGLVWAGAGVEYVSAYLAVVLAFVLGAFFVYVSRAEARARRAMVGPEGVVPQPPSRP
jgi:ABC-type transport system involved in Fe-S cluster assembly fused permease/ATPase subunit